MITQEELRINGKKKTLGLFATELEAHEKYLSALKDLQK